MAETWAEAVGTWDTRTDHWTTPYSVNTIVAGPMATAVALITTHNNTMGVPAAMTGPTPADINWRWRIESTPLVGPIGTRAATVNLRSIVNTVALAVTVVRGASINWAFNTVAIKAGPSGTPRPADINLRWRVEPTPVAGIATTLAVTGNFTFTNLNTTVALYTTGPFATTKAFIQTAPWDFTSVTREIWIPVEDRTIVFSAEDRELDISAEDRTITIRK